MSTNEVEVVPYTVQQGDSCARIARRQYGDRARYDLIHAYNAGMGPEPHRHVSGHTLCLPQTAPPRDSGPLARVTALRQDVRQRPPTREEWEPAQLDQAVERGHRVNTLERAFAELTFADTTIVTLRGDTVVVVYGASGGAVRRSATEAVLERGTLRSRLGALRAGHRLQVRTPSSRLTLEGGSAVASVDASETTRLSNHEGGAAQLSDATGRGSVRVRPGMGSRVARGRRPSPPQPLPDAPDWSTGQVSRFVGVAQLTTVEASWQPVTGARSYRVEIARRADGRDLVAQLEVPSEVHSFSMHRLPPGTYYARLATIDGDLFESRPSDAWSFEVVLGTLLEPGVEAPTEFDYGDPLEEAGRVAVLPGARLVPPSGIHCALGGGDAAQAPAGELRLVETGVQELACSDADGAVGTFAVEVVQVTLVAASETSSLELARGAETALELSLTSAEHVAGDLRLEGSEGLEVLDWERDDDRLTVRVRASEDAPSAASVHLLFEDEATVIAAVDISITHASAGEPSASALDDESLGAAAPDRASVDHEIAWPQTLGTSLFPSVVGLRDGSREGLGAWLGGAYLVSPDDPSAQRVRGTAGARAGLIGGELQLELAIAGDFEGAHDRTSRRGVGDLYAAAGYARRLDDAALVFDLGAFFPTNSGEGGIGVVRLVPTISAQLELHETLLFRTRQGVFVDLDDSGNTAWVSAYGVDARVLGPLVLGLEVDFTLGREDGDLLLVPLAGASLSIVSGPIVVGLAGRFALTEEAQEALAPASAMFTIEGRGSLEGL